MVGCTEAFHRLLKVLANHSEVAIERTSIRNTLVLALVVKIVNAAKVEQAGAARKESRDCEKKGCSHNTVRSSDLAHVL